MGVINYIANKAATSSVVKKFATSLFHQMGYPFYNGNAPVIVSQPYNGEKNAGELGAVKNYVPDFITLSARSWQAYTESEIAQLIIHNFMLWTVGSGLKFKAEPSLNVLDQNKLKLKSEVFINLTESNFNLFLNSKRSTTARNKTFNQLSYEIVKHAIIGGDCVVILDYGRPTDRNKSISARLIDGFYIQSPIGNINTDNGNKVFNGVEINEYGEPVAYWMVMDDMTHKRIPAYTPTGTMQAFIYHGLDYRVDDYRGMPILSCVLETMKKLDRYKEATVGSAEEIAKMTMFVKHEQYSTGEDPIAKMKIAAGHGMDPGTEKITNDLLKATAANVSYTTGKKVVNMPIGATLESLENKNPLYFKDFYTINFEILCATLGIPPEVALNKYTSSFSSSRGANKNWEHKILFERDKIANGIYQPFYNYWLEMEVYNDRIIAPGYVVAKTMDSFMILEAYQRCKFIGAKMPFIDPLKEVQAARAMLGDQITPLSTYEAVTENLNNGDFNTNIRQAQAEKENAVARGFTIEPVLTENPPGDE